MGGGTYDLYSNIAVKTEYLSRPNNNGHFTITQWVVRATRSGNIVSLSFNVYGSMPAFSDILELIQLPALYRPAKYHIWNYITQNGDAMMIEVLETGSVVLYNGNKNVNGYFLRQTITYPVD